MKVLQTIVATAIPTITHEWGLGDVAWYFSVFSMTAASFQSSWGKAYGYWPPKPIFIIATWYVTKLDTDGSPVLIRTYCTIDVLMGANTVAHQDCLQ